MANELYITAAGDASTIYAIIRRKSDMKVWDAVASAWDTWANGDIADYDVPLTTQGGDVYAGDFPADIAIGTRVLIQYYNQSGGTPAITDALLLTTDSTWNGAELASASSVSLDSRALTTLASVKRHLRITDTGDDTLLTELINQVSDRIERLTNRRFAAANYAEWTCDSGLGELAVRNFPVIRVDRVRTNLTAALDVSYSGSDIEATVGVQYDEEGQNGLIRLVSVASDGTETANEITFSDEPSLSAMATAITAVSDWTATKKPSGDALCSALEPVNATDAKNRTVTLDHAADYDTVERVNHRTGLIYLRRRPRSGALFGGDMGAVGGDWSGGESRRLVQYRGGYASIPDDVARVANEMVQIAYHLGQKNPTIQSETIPDYSYTLANQVEMTDDQMNRLAPYIDLAVGGVC